MPPVVFSCFSKLVRKIQTRAEFHQLHHTSQKDLQKNNDELFHELLRRIITSHLQFRAIKILLNKQDPNVDDAKLFLLRICPFNHFTLSSARWFYSSRGDVSDGKKDK